MKNFCFPFVFSLFSIFALPNIAGQSVTPKENASGLLSFQVANVYFEVDPSFGGRISSVKVDNDEMMFADRTYRVYLWGSTLWQSPQSTWNWPPSLALDQDPYEGGIAGDSISLLSEVDGNYNTNLRFRKTFHANLADTSISILYTFMNTGTTAKSFSQWELARVPSGGLVFFPYGPGGESGAFANQFVKSKNIEWFKYKGTEPEGQKYFCDGSEGWYAFVNDNNELFLRKYADVLPAKQAPGEKDNEMWYEKASAYLELEVQSAYTNIPAGGNYAWPVKWFIRKLPSDITAEVGNQKLIDYVRALVNRVPANPTGIENIQTPLVMVYPNPVSNILHIECNVRLKENSVVKIYNMQGQLVLANPLNQKSALNLQNLSAGIYMYDITENNISIQRAKLVVKR
jgi:hypothetical protein